MHWFQSLMFLGCGYFFSHAVANVIRRTKEDICVSKISWRNLWKQIDKLNEGGVSQECLRMDKSSLCDPVQMAITNISEDVSPILQILSETAALFELEDIPFSGMRDFLEYNYVTQEELKICLQSHFSHHHLAMIKECFEKMRTFLNSQEDRTCAWEVVHQDSLVVLQQLEYYVAASQLK